MSKGAKLSREEIANIEIGHTDVSHCQQWVLSLSFLLFIGLYPTLQFISHSPLREWRSKETIQDSIKAYETAIEDTSLLRKWLLPPPRTTLFDRSVADRQ